jgi:hypothetical protein
LLRFDEKKKRLALRDMTTKYHIFVIILVFPKENQIVFGRYWVVEFVKKIGGLIDGLFRNF